LYQPDLLCNYQEFSTPNRAPNIVQNGGPDAQSDKFFTISDLNLQNLRNDDD